MSEEIFYNSLCLFAESGYKRLGDLYAKFGGWENAWKNSGKETGGRDPEADWRRVSRAGMKLFLRGSPGYPAFLEEIPHPPFGIYVLGETGPGSDKLAIVGTRKATAEGRNLAKKFAAELSAAGLSIVSGLALGIDAAAHEGCLEAGGRTIAVLGNGLDYFYPRTNEKLAKKILAGGGAIVSEYPPGTPPLPFRFLERNRIISGLCRGVLLVEAPKESGALATARFALEQNRDVFVVPGPVSHPNFIGSNQLIRKGAALITTPEEILEDLGLCAGKEKIGAAGPENEEEKTILEALRNISSPATIDKIVEMTHLGISAANKTLTYLIIKDVVQETDGGYALK